MSPEGGDPVQFGHLVWVLGSAYEMGSPGLRDLVRLGAPVPGPRIHLQERTLLSENGRAHFSSFGPIVEEQTEQLLQWNENIKNFGEWRLRLLCRQWTL